MSRPSHSRTRRRAEPAALPHRHRLALPAAPWLQPTHWQAAARPLADSMSRKTGKTSPNSPLQAEESPMIRPRLQSDAEARESRHCRRISRDLPTPASPWRIYSSRIMSFSRPNGSAKQSGPRTASCWSFRRMAVVVAGFASGERLRYSKMTLRGLIHLAYAP
jgi:hypothetical protein